MVFIEEFSASMEDDFESVMKVEQPIPTIIMDMYKNGRLLLAEIYGDDLNVNVIGGCSDVSM